MGPAVDVGVAAEEPDHVGAFDLPDVPDAVFADVLVFEEGHVEIVVAAGFDVLQGLFALGLAEGFQQIGDDFFDEVFLVGAEFGEGDAFEALGFAGELDGVVAVFIAGFAEEGELALFAVEGLEDFVGAFGLVPVGVAGVVGLFIEALGSVAVEDGAAEGCAFLAVAIAAAGAVAAGEDELELTGAGLAEERDGGAAKAAVAFVVLIELTLDFGFVFVAVEFVEDLAHEFLLVGLEDVADFLRGDVPVVVDLEAAGIAPGEAEGFALGFVHAAVELLDEGFRGGGGSGAEGGAKEAHGGDLRAAGHEVAAVDRRGEGLVHVGVVPNVALNGKFLFSIRPYRKRA